MSCTDCLLIGKELINKIRLSKKEWGFINGFKNEKILGAISADIGETKPVTCNASHLIAESRFSARYESNFYWTKIEDEFIKKIENFQLNFSNLYGCFPVELSDIIINQINRRLIFRILALGKAQYQNYFISVFKKDHEFIILKEDIELLDEHPSIFDRIDGIIPIKELKEKKITIVGLGSGGGFISLELAAAGVGTMYFFDKDRLNITNLFRHICDKRDIGRKKVDAVADVIKEHMLPTLINKYDCNVLYNVDELRSTIKESDLVVCATDDTRSRSLVNYICVAEKKTLILVCSFDNATVGEIIKVTPGETGCYECIRTQQREQGSIKDDKHDNDSEIMSYSSQIGDDIGFSKGTRTDVFMIAAIAAKLVIMNLTNEEFSFNYITWGAIRNMKFNEPFIFEYPFTAKYCKYNIHPNCPICGNVPDELKGINIEDKYNEIMEKVTGR
jgi:molybdopterin/thiamine biosynthesis adenylyltransferase